MNIWRRTGARLEAWLASHQAGASKPYQTLRAFVDLLKLIAALTALAPFGLQFYLSVLAVPQVQMGRGFFLWLVVGIAGAVALMGVAELLELLLDMEGHAREIATTIRRATEGLIPTGSD